MKYVTSFDGFKKALSKPSVFIFILLGVGFMFLTFLTHSNALELAISGIASMFIGIGVNNFTSIETAEKDELRMQTKIKRTVKALHHLQEKLQKIHQMIPADPELIEIEVSEMSDYIDLSIQYLEEDL